jgi:hypothetical protein
MTKSGLKKMTAFGQLSRNPPSDQAFLSRIVSDITHPIFPSKILFNRHCFSNFETFGSIFCISASFLNFLFLEEPLRT